MVSFLVVTLLGVAQRVHYGLMGFLVMSGVLMVKRAQDSLRGEGPLKEENSFIAAGGFVVLSLLNSVLVLWMGVARAKGCGGVRTGNRVYSVARFAAMLLTAFAVVLGGFMVGGSARKEQVDCSLPVDCGGNLNLGVKWFGAAFAVGVFLLVAVCEAFGILEGFGNTLAAFVATAGVLLMDLVDMGLDEKLSAARGVVQNIQVAGFIVLSVVSLIVILTLGYLSGSKPQGQGEAGSSAIASAVNAAFQYSLLPLALGWTMALAGLLQLHGSGWSYHLTYWTLAAEGAAVIVAVIAKQWECVKLKVPSILFVVMVTVSLMGRAEKFMEGDKEADEYVSIAPGGFILTTAINFILIILLGWEESNLDWPGFSPLIETSQ